MSVLFPTFLLALLALGIPLLIHLFNLRKYKKVYFPHTRFLKNIALQSRRQSKIQQKLLLALRMLFLLLLIMGFAQPFFKGRQTAGGPKLYTLFIDNSYSTSVQEGASDVLEKEKQSARTFINQLPNDAHLFIATHTPPTQYEALSKEQALATLSDIDFVSQYRLPEQIIQQTKTVMESEGLSQAAILYWSDFQKSSDFSLPKKLPDHITFTGIQLKPGTPNNITVDTAWLADAGMTSNNKIVVRTTTTLPAPQSAPSLQLSVNGQTKSAATPHFNADGVSVDTLTFSVNEEGWQKISVQVEDKALRFDDTFRIAARLTPQLSVLHLYNGSATPYMVAALHSDPQLNVEQRPMSSISTTWGNYNLIVLDGVGGLSKTEGNAIAAALNKGISVVLFPARNSQYSNFNEGLAALGDLAFTGLDTASQNVVSLQQSHELVQDIFDNIPRQVQLPTVNWHYKIASGFQANKQMVMGFRNGDPFLAKYDVQGGSLYLCAASAGADAGNFASSYFFVPFLYRMAMLSQGANSYAVTAGRNQSIQLPLKAVGERNVVHLYGQGKDMIPVQRPSGNGVALFTDAATTQSGFYTLHAMGNDSALLAINPDRRESQLQYYSLKELNEGKPADLRFTDNPSFLREPLAGSASFPIWKVCVLLALLLLAIESWVLWRNLTLNRPSVTTKFSSE